MGIGDSLSLGRSDSSGRSGDGDLGGSELGILDSGFVSKSLLGRFDDLGELSRIGDGNLGKHLAVKLDVGEVETMDELRIAQAVGLGSSGNTADPKLSEIVLAISSSDVGIVKGVDDSLIGGLEKTMSGSSESLGKLQDSIVLATKNITTFDSHNSLFLLLLADKTLHCFSVSSVEITGVTKISLLLVSLAQSQVGSVLVVLLHFSGSSDLETFCDCSLSLKLLLCHFSFPFDATSLKSG